MLAMTICDGCMVQDLTWKKKEKIRSKYLAEIPMSQPHEYHAFVPFEIQGGKAVAKEGLFYYSVSVSRLRPGAAGACMILRNGKMPVECIQPCETTQLTCPELNR